MFITQVNSHNSLDVRTKNICQGSENVNTLSESQNVKKQPNNGACSLCQIRQKQLLLNGDVYSVPLPMSISYSSTKNMKKFMMNCIKKRTMTILETFTTTQYINVHIEINMLIMIRTIIYINNKPFCLRTSMVCLMFRYQQ